MKLLIAFALLAVAFADEIKVVDLPPFDPSPAFASIDIRQLIIPDDVMEAIKNGDITVVRDVGHEDAIPQAVEDLIVRFVDAPLEVDVSEYDEGIEVHYAEPTAEEIVVPEPVMLGEAPMPAFETVDDIPVEAVRIAEPVLPTAEAVEAIVPESVKVFEPSVPAVEGVNIVEPFEDAPGAVMFVDAPLEDAEEIYAPDAVRIVEAPLPADETLENAAPAVEPIKVAVPRYFGKQFEDPTWR